MTMRDPERSGVAAFDGHAAPGGNPPPAENGGRRGEQDLALKKETGPCAEQKHSGSDRFRSELWGQP